MSEPRRKSVVPALLGVVLLSSSPAALGQYAAQVAGYNPGTGYATEFGTGLGYTLADAALGEPSRSTPGPFGGPVDPFAPPYLRDQIVSVGQGGSLDVRFDQPIANDPAHPFGIDFSVYGATGFVIVNGDYSGGGITDGSRFGDNGAVTRVSVSADGIRYYLLDPSLARNVEAGLPTDGSGDFSKAIDPNPKLADFAGLGLAGIRSAYAGGAGGAGYDLSWARDGSGNPVVLDAASYVRVEVVSGHAEIDGFAAVRTVPEPRSWLLALGGLGAVLAWRRSAAGRVR
jgi:hypothetical protein